MKHLSYFLALFSVIALIAAAADDRQKGKGGGKGGPGGGAGVEPAVVPEYLFNVMLGRPGADSISASVLAWKNMEAVISYGERADAMSLHSPVIKLMAGESQHITLDRLKPNTLYFYQLAYRLEGGKNEYNSVRSFVTQRAPAATFTFAMQADSHLDTSTDVRVYEQTLANIRADKPDFMIDLGDTTMVDKFGSFYTRAETQYKAQRYYLGQIAHNVPVLFALGNHDGEQGSRLTGQADSMPLWSLGMRKKYFANPEPSGIYTGNATPFEKAGLLQDYFAWEWGNALFIVLDPFWFTRDRKGDDNWGMTLGEAQYRWLTAALRKSKLPFKFVFIHHLVGGLGRDVRGGANTAPYMEWGGKNADGSDGFAQHRPGWALPLHQLFVKNGVSIVFHGHDHLFVKEELDGIIYQEVPQPGHPNGGTRSAVEYGYSGVVLGSSGHLRVTVESKEAVVEYVRATVTGVTKDNGANGAVDHRYRITPRS
jgi:predicted phosphodiesterase